MESLLILVPLFCIIILNLPLKDLMRKIAFFVAALLFLIQIAMVVFHPTALLSTITNALSPYFVLNFSVDRLSLVMLLTIGLVELVALIVGNYLISDYRLRFKFINLLVVACIGMNAMVMVRDLFSLYVFLEITAVSAFILIAIQKGKLALESAFKYLLLSAIASVLMLTAISIILLVSGDLTFLSIAKGLALNGNSFYIKLSIALFLCGLLIKSGVVPFHGWLPDVYQASPTYTSILVAGVLTKISGVYVLIRLVSTVFGNDIQIQTILMFAGALSIVVGALAALGQKDFKRMLAYSSISQVGYMILALGCGTPLALAGCVFHFFNHATFKSLLFTNAAAVEKQVGTTDMDEMGGLGMKMPITSFTSVVAFLSTAGIPPLSGFWSKFIIIFALWTAGYYGYAVLALLASAITISYFLSMQRRVFFGKLRQGLENITEASWQLNIVAITLCIIIVGVGCMFPFFIGKFMNVSKDLVMVIK